MPDTLDPVITFRLLLSRPGLMTLLSKSLSECSVEITPVIIVYSRVIAMNRQGLHVFSISFTDKNGDKQEIIIGPEQPSDAVKDRRVSQQLHEKRILANSDNLQIVSSQHCRPLLQPPPGW